MLGIDSLVVAGLATLHIGNIQEADGPIERTFWLRNPTPQPVTILQGYTSCGCTTIQYDKESPIPPGDSTLVTLRFNPQGKGGEFYESGTIVYETDGKRRFTHVAIEGNCVTSDETLLRQYPILVAPGLRQSVNRYDLGYMSPGQSKTLYTSLLHQDDANRKETIPLTLTIDDATPKGLQHITRQFSTTHNGATLTVTVTFDVYVK